MTGVPHNFLVIRRNSSLKLKCRDVDNAICSVRSEFVIETIAANDTGIASGAVYSGMNYIKEGCCRLCDFTSCRPSSPLDGIFLAVSRTV